MFLDNSRDLCGEFNFQLLTQIPFAAWLELMHPPLGRIWLLHYDDQASELRCDKVTMQTESD